MEANQGDRVRRRGDARCHVRRTGQRGIDRDVGEPVFLQEAERVRALVRVHPGAVAKLDQGHERFQPAARPCELVLRLLRLHEARVVLEQDAAELPRQLQRLERTPEGRERGVARLPFVEGHRGARLDVEREVIGRALGPAPCHLGVGEGVVRRVDLDDVEALGVVAQPGLGG